MLLIFILRIHRGSREYKNELQGRKLTTSELCYMYYVLLAATIVCGSYLLGECIEQKNHSYRVVVCGAFRGYAVVWTANDLIFLANYNATRIGDRMALVKVDKDVPLVWEMKHLDIQRSRFDS